MITNFLFSFLQVPVAEMPATKPALEDSYLSVLMKGGWILVPIILLSLVSVYVIADRWMVIRKARNKDRTWLMHIIEMVKDGKTDKATIYSSSLNNSSARVVRAGLEDLEYGVDEMEESMQVASRQEINRLENQMNYLGITAAIAPMLGFLGTIFGVIKIFYNIAQNNNLDIANISDGLYQKMICSGVGLFVGIIAYAGYYLLNGRIDRVVTQMEQDSNDVLKGIRQYKKTGK